MIKFISRPNLPSGKVKSAVIGKCAKAYVDFLNQLGIELSFTDTNSFVNSAISNHADISLIHLGDNLFLSDKKQTALIKKLMESGCEVLTTEKDIKGNYPKDIALNFLLAGDKAIGNFKNIDGTLKKMISNFSEINVNQGYAKCSSLLVNEKALITDDNSIYTAAVSKEFDCLLISKGDIILEGHNYGFIGGASGKISKDEIVFFGDITTHRDYEKIRDFIEGHGCKLVYPENVPLKDIGGIIPITEEIP